MQKKPWQRAVDAMFPATCLRCHCQLNDCAFALCEQCNRELPRLYQPCPRCAADDCAAKLCPRCWRQAPEVEQHISVFRYQEPITGWLLGFKFYQQQLHGKTLTQCLLHDLQTRDDIVWPEVIVPVPLHHWRLRWRGFNQAGEIAKRLAKSLQIPINQKLLFRQRNTPRQMALTRNQRLRNCDDAFNVVANNYQTVALVDDVVTTGSTIEACATELKNSGVQRVVVWSLARASLG